ncbi:hypothetical protein D3C84_982180 [compost metagenome]
MYTQQISICRWIRSEHSTVLESARLAQQINCHREAILVEGMIIIKFILNFLVIIDKNRLCKLLVHIPNSPELAYNFV